MKKLLLSTLFGAVFCLAANAQQVSFGLTAGYANITVKGSNENSDVASTSDASGFYVGALADFTLSQNIILQPSVNYMIAEDTNFLLIPIMAKFYVSDSGFHLQAGPQGTLILEDTMGFLKTFGLDLALGAGYDINSNFFVEAKYALGLTNRITNELEELGAEGASIKFNTLTAGIGYRF